jgi:hypothetical protein
MHCPWSMLFECFRCMPLSDDKRWSRRRCSTMRLRQDIKSVRWHSQTPYSSCLLVHVLMEARTKWSFKIALMNCWSSCWLYRSSIRWTFAEGEWVGGGARRRGWEFPRGKHWWQILYSQGGSQRDYFPKAKRKQFTLEDAQVELQASEQEIWQALKDKHILTIDGEFPLAMFWTKLTSIVLCSLACLCPCPCPYGALRPLSPT